MRVLLTGATGFIGSAVLARLIEAGHEVIAVVRSDASAAIVEAGGATAVVHALPDTAWLASALAEVDGAIHAATTDDGTAPDFDASVVDAVIDAFSDGTKPYVHTGGVWVYGNGDDLDEDSGFDAPAITAWREDVESRLLSSGVKASVVAPAVVYGHGKGMANIVTGAPTTDEGAILIGSGDQHWATVHVDDLADLYLAVLENATGGESYLAASGHNPTVREMHEAVFATVLPQSEEQTRERFGALFADALLLDQQAAGLKAKREFGWAPHRGTLIDELRG